jgi:hypothetical protein
MNMEPTIPNPLIRSHSSPMYSDQHAGLEDKTRKLGLCPSFIYPPSSHPSNEPPLSNIRLRSWGTRVLRNLLE